MKRFRSLLMLSLALSSAACNVDPADPEVAQALQSSGQEMIILPTMPNSCPSGIPLPPVGMPSTPTPLSSLPLGTPLYPAVSTLKSAYTVIATDPNDSNAFLAFGFDVMNRQLMFYVSGRKATELRRLMTQLAVDIDAIEQGTGMDQGFTWGTSGQVGGPIIPQPGIHDGAWKVAYNNAYKMDEYLVDAPLAIPR